MNTSSYLLESDHDHDKIAEDSHWISIAKSLAIVVLLVMSLLFGIWPIKR